MDKIAEINIIKISETTSGVGAMKWMVMVLVVLIVLAGFYGCGPTLPTQPNGNGNNGSHTSSDYRIVAFVGNYNLSPWSVVYIERLNPEAAPANSGFVRINDIPYYLYVDSSDAHFAIYVDTSFIDYMPNQTYYLNIDIGDTSFYCGAMSPSTEEITITEPEYGEIFVAGADIDVYWDYVGGFPPVVGIRIRSYDDYIFQDYYEGGTTTNFTIPGDVTLGFEGEATIEVSAISQVSIYPGDSRSFFSIYLTRVVPIRITP